MKPFTFVGKVLIAGTILVVIQIALGSVITSGPAPPKNALSWFLLSTFLMAAAVVCLGMRSDWPNPVRALALAAIPAVITLCNYLDGILFLTNSGIDWPKEILRICLMNVIAFPLWMILFRKGETESGANYNPLARPGVEKLWRFALADLAYPVLYFIAGMIIFPYVRDFYATQTLPPVAEVFSVQLLIRGPIYIVICLLMTRMLGLPRVAGAVAMGLIFTTLSGIVGLIIPSGVFPDAVRWAHFYEVTISNFVFGVFVGWLWGKPEPVAQLASKAA